MSDARTDADSQDPRLVGDLYSRVQWAHAAHRLGSDCLAGNVFDHRHLQRLHAAVRRDRLHVELVRVARSPTPSFLAAVKS